ncbi:MAG: hypothetical protein EZS28_044018, partial [Streblomastix strix]
MSREVSIELWDGEDKQVGIVNIPFKEFENNPQMHEYELVAPSGSENEEQIVGIIGIDINYIPGGDKIKVKMIDEGDQTDNQTEDGEMISTGQILYSRPRNKALRSSIESQDNEQERERIQNKIRKNRGKQGQGDNEEIEGEGDVEGEGDKDRINRKKQRKQRYRGDGQEQEEGGDKERRFEGDEQDEVGREVREEGYNSPDGQGRIRQYDDSAAQTTNEYNNYEPDKPNNQLQQQQKDEQQVDEKQNKNIKQQQTQQDKQKQFEQQRQLGQQTEGQQTDEQFTNLLPSGKVEIDLIGVKNIAPMDLNGKSDPYIKVILGQQEGTTKRYKNALNAEFNETFTLQYDPIEVPSNELKLELWDYDTFSSDDIIGIINIP